MPDDVWRMCLAYWPTLGLLVYSPQTGAAEHGDHGVGVCDTPQSCADNAALGDREDEQHNLTPGSWKDGAVLDDM